MLPERRRDLRRREHPRPRRERLRRACAAASCSRCSTSRRWTPQVWRSARRRLLGAGRPRSGAAGRARVPRRDGGDPDRDVALRAGAARAASTRSTSRTASTPRCSRAARRARASALGLPAERVRRRRGGDEQGRPVAQVAAADRRGVRRASARATPRRCCTCTPSSAARYDEGYDLRAAAGTRSGSTRTRSRSPTSTATASTRCRREHMADLYSSFDVLLNPAMGEGFGLPVLEAQACGVPAIVTDFTAMSEVCGAGWKVGYDRVRTPMRSWQAWPKVDEIVAALEACYALAGGRPARALRAGPRARAALRRRPRLRGALAAGAGRDRARLADRAPVRDPREGRMKPLVVIPNYMSHEADMEILGECVQSIRRTVSDTVDILIVDDCSPQPWLVDVFEERYGALRLRADPQGRERGLLAHGQRRPRAGARRGPRGDPDERRHRHAHAGLARRAAGAPHAGTAARRRAAAVPERPDPARRAVLLADRERLRAPLPLRARQPARGATSPTVCPVTGAFQYIPPAVLEQRRRLRPASSAWATRTSTTACACSRPASRASTSRRSARSTTSRCSARGPDEKLQRWHDLSLAHLRQKWAHLPRRRARRRGMLMDALFVAQTADASCYHRDHAAGAGARLRLVRARRAAAADGGRPRRGARRRTGGPTSAATTCWSCRRRRRTAGST